MARTPVIMVPGLNGKVASFTRMVSELKSVDGVVTDVFNYESVAHRWIADGDTAHRLAKMVVCYSKLYGNKRVILVTHSMGGLLAREMLDWAAYGTFAKKVVGHIVTIGTPHKGSILANADSSFWMALCKAPAGIFSLTDDIDSLCRQAEWGRATAGLSINSQQLAKLPKFPRGMTIKAIAGNAQLETCALWGCSAKSSGGDLVVSVRSATDEYTSTGNGDGKKVFTCTTVTLNPLVADAWCEHSHMLQAPQVQSEVKASIRAYLASVKSADVAQAAKKMTLGGLNIPAPGVWGLQGAGTAIDTSTCTRSSEPDFWKLCAHMTVESGGDDRKAVWYSLCSDQLLSTTDGNIGGKKATVYQYGRCDAYESPGVAYLWHVPGSVSIEYRLSDKGKPMTGIREALSAATWN